METLLATSIGMNIGFIASFFIQRRHVRKLWDWIRGRRAPKEDLQDLIHDLGPERTPLMRKAQGDAYFAKYQQDVEESDRLWKMPPAPRGYPPQSYVKQRLLPEGEDPWKWDLRYDENGKPYLTERCREA